MEMIEYIYILYILVSDQSSIAIVLVERPCCATVFKHCRCLDFVGRFGEHDDVMKQGQQKLDDARTTSRFN